MGTIFVALLVAAASPVWIAGLLRARERRAARARAEPDRVVMIDTGVAEAGRLRTDSPFTIAKFSDRSTRL